LSVEGKGWASHGSSLSIFDRIFVDVSQFVGRFGLAPSVYQQLDSSDPDILDAPLSWAVELQEEGSNDRGANEGATGDEHRSSSGHGSRRPGLRYYLLGSLQGDLHGS
jgi:hypothetical protein